MREEKNRIDERHRKELLGFLLVKTAAVRQGVKPAELLRVRHCYEGVNSEGLHVCLYRGDIYGILGLDYMGLGDSIGFADSFCMAAETLATAAKDAGATLVGDVLKLDDTNEADQTDGKIAAWVETIKA